MDDIEFYKMSGAGNDFILIDNRESVFTLPDESFAVSQLCRRAISIGADGLILMEKPDDDDLDFKWRFFNSDGSDADMCGNAARCAARLSFLLGISKRSISFSTGAGIVHAKIVESGNVRVILTNPTDIRIGGSISLDTFNRGAETEFDFINTGVPHVVVDVADEDALSKLDIKKVGSEIRYHTEFQPAGTNVNFVSYKTDGSLKTRTYERGVEGETLACGTGAVATAVLSHKKGKASSPVTVVPTSQIPLLVHFNAEDEEISEVVLEGDARLIYRGYFNPEALD